MLSMDISMGKCVLMLMVCVMAESAASLRLDSSSSSICQLDSVPFLHDLNSQCPFTDPFTSSPIQVIFLVDWLIEWFCAVCLDIGYLFSFYCSIWWNRAYKDSEFSVIGWCSWIVFELVDYHMITLQLGFMFVVEFRFLFEDLFGALISLPAVTKLYF